MRIYRIPTPAQATHPKPFPHTRSQPHLLIAKYPYPKLENAAGQSTDLLSCSSPVNPDSDSGCPFLSRSIAISQQFKYHLNKSKKPMKEIINMLTSGESFLIPFGMAYLKVITNLR